MNPKHITARELASIVSSLLMHPHTVLELDERSRYARFMKAIGEVVADFCGGEVQSPVPAMGEGHAESRYAHVTDDDDRSVVAPQRELLLPVLPNDSLPGLNDNIWASFDPGNGWYGCLSGDEIAERQGGFAGVLPANDMAALKEAIHVLRRAQGGPGSNEPRQRTAELCDLAASLFNDDALAWSAEAAATVAARTTGPRG